MRNLFKKSLTLCLVAILAFSCFAGIVSAENPFTATIAVENQTITQGTTSVDVFLDITSSEVGINEALIEVSSPLGTIATEATLVSYTTANNEKASIEYPKGSTNFGSFYLSVADDLTTDPSTMGSLSAAEIKVTFTVAADAELKDYDINIAVDGVRAASGNEDVISFTYSTAKVTVAAPHVHKEVWAPDTEKAGYHTSKCDTADCDGTFVPTTEACADGDDEDLLCDKCGYDMAPAEPEGPVYDASLKFKGKTALFESDYSLVYYVPVKLGSSWYIEVSREIFSKNTRLEDKKVTLTIDDVAGTTKPGDGNEYYLVTLRGIATKEVANEIVAVLHNEVDGVDYYGDELSYNLVDYAVARMAKNKANEVKYLQAFLNYAAACQVKFGYNTTDLANSVLSEEAKAITLNGEITQDSDVKEYEVLEGATAKLGGFAPSYEDKMTLGTIFKAPDNYVEAGLKIRYSYVNSSGVRKTDYVSLADSAEYTKAPGYRIVDFTGLAIKEVRTPVLVTVVDANNNPISNTRQYSFEAYAAKQGTTSTDYTPARAMIAFGDWFKVYKDNQ